MANVTTTVTELPESRVRVQAEIAPEEVEKRLVQAARSLGSSVRIPGFRPGKVPPAVLIRRFGREAVLDEAIRNSLNAWFSDAVDEAGIVPIGEPEDLDLPDPTEAAEGDPVAFSFEIGVRPTAVLGDYKGLEVPREDPTVSEEAIDQEIEQLRERGAKLETVEKTVEQGDFLIMDFVGTVDGVPFDGGEAHDQMLEIGSGRFIPGFEDGLLGATAGEERTVDVTFPDEYHAPELAGKAAQFAVTVKEVRAKQLPEVDDEFAADQGFDTVQELREDLRTRALEAGRGQAESRFREAALDAAVANAQVEVPEALAKARAHELWHETVHTLSHQGIDKDTYLRITGRTEEEILEEGRAEAELSLRREAVVSAIIEREGDNVRPDEAALLEALKETAEKEGSTPEKMLKQVRKNGRLEAFVEDLAARRVVELIAETAKPVEAKPDTDVESDAGAEE